MRPIRVAMTSYASNRRKSGRFEANFECYAAGVRIRGRGVIEDISRAGALVECTPLCPERGELVGLALKVEGCGLVVVLGRVVRQTVGGFALEFEYLSSQAERFIDDVAALVEAQRRFR